MNGVPANTGLRVEESRHPGAYPAGEEGISAALTLRVYEGARNEIRGTQTIYRNLLLVQPASEGWGGG